MDYDLPALSNQLAETYNNDELRELCFHLGIYHELFAQRTKQEMARELVTYLDRRNRIPDLILKCKEERPLREWNFILSQQVLKAKSSGNR